MAGRFSNQHKRCIREEDYREEDYESNTDVSIIAISVNSFPVIRLEVRDMMFFTSKKHQLKEKIMNEIS
jgi:hypothetical protein